MTKSLQSILWSYLNPQATDALLKKEIALMQKAIKTANIKLD